MKMTPFFQPGATALIAATSSTGNVALPAGGSQLAVLNNGAEVVFIKFGTSAVTAAVTDTPVEFGIARGFTKPGNATHVAAITASGNCTIYFTAGEGA